MAIVVGWLHRLGVTPNTVTYTGFILTAFIATLLAMGEFFIGGLLLIGVSLLDLVDGSLARATSQSSTFGAFLDSTLDRYSEAITFLALTFFYSSSTEYRWEVVLVFLTVVGSLMVSYTRARAEALRIECKEGWLQRPERIFLLIVGLLTGWMLPVLLFMAIFTNVTAVQRIYQVYRKIQFGESPAKARVIAPNDQPTQ